MPSHLLVISDVHLGEYAKEMDRIGYLKGFARGDSELCAFLEYHQSRWIGGVPWRLVINGDFIDFIAVTFQPSESQTTAQPELELSEDESRFGLDSSADKVVWKLDRIIDRHGELFTYLADFIGHGNSVDILYGNHDVEFWWPEVHARFRERLRQIYFGGESVEGKDPEAFVKRVRFHPWFLYEAGKFYIEHGNQYDDFSSFEYRLHPVSPADDQQLAMPVSHMAIRYFVNQYKGFRSHDKDRWTIFDYMRWLKAQGMDNVARIFRLYVLLSSQVWAYSRATRVADATALREVHQRSLDAIASVYGMTAEQARELDALHNPPVTESLGRTIQAIGVDWYVWGAFWALAAFVVLAIPFPLHWTLLLWALVGLGAYGSRRLWPAIRHRWLGSNVTTAVAPKVDAATRRIAEILDVQYIFFGHTHKPRKVKVRDSPPCWYLNGGSWLATRRRERHTQVGDRDVCPSRLTFIVYRDGSVPDARLFRWCARDGRPVPFDPRGGIETLEPEKIERLGAGARAGRPGAAGRARRGRR